VSQGAPPGVLPGAVAAAAGRGLARVALAHPPGGRGRFDRVNHRGEPVTLLEGPALVTAALIALLIPAAPARLRAAAAVATTGAAALGAYDDLVGDGDSKGLRGHFIALRAGRLSTGVVKVVGLAVTGVAAAALVAGPPRAGRDGAGPLGLLVGGAVVAGSANLVNLLDLRPGRALKAVLLCSALVRGRGAPIAAVTAGAALGALGDDLAERSMLGDTGANAAGALVGVALLAGAGPRARVAVLTVLGAATLASERVSFSAVIDRTPVLRAIDRLGRRPAPNRS